MLSEDFVNKYQAQAIGNADAMGLVDKAAAFTTSTITDIGISLWNSIIALPKLLGVNTDEYRADTYETLKRTNEDFANFYTDNKNSIEAASFFGGTLLPAGLAMKGMKVLQAGKLGFYPTAINDVTQAARISELEKMLEAGGKATTEFRNLRWKVLTASAGQEIMQAAGAELAVVASLSQHAWMEDYLKDPVSAATISMLMGGTIGIGVGQIATRKTLAESLGKISSEAMDTVLKKAVDIPLGASDVDSMQRFTVNAKILRDIATDESNSPLVRQIADDFATHWEGAAGEIEAKHVFGPGISKLDNPVVKQGIRDVVLSDAAFGANQVDFYTIDPKSFMAGSREKAGFLPQEAFLKTKEKFDRGLIIKNLINDKAEELGRELGGVSHLKPIIERVSKVYMEKGTEAGKAYLDDLAKSAPEFSNFSNEVATSGFIESLHQALSTATRETTDKLAAQLKMTNLWEAGYRIRAALTASEGIKDWKPDWSKLMKEQFHVGYSPFHKAWIPTSELPFYSRAVDTGQTAWQSGAIGSNVYKINQDATFEFAAKQLPSALSDQYWINSLGSAANASLEKSIYIATGDLGVQNGWLSRLSQLQAEGKPLPKLYLVDDAARGATQTELKKAGKEVSLEELQQNLQAEKQRQIKALLQSGASIQEIGIKTNTPAATIEKWLIEGGSLAEHGDWRMYTSSTKIEGEYLGQQTRMLSFATNGNKIASLSFRNADMSANLDAQAIKRQNRELMADAIAEGQSTLARQFFQTMNATNSAGRSVWDIFEAQLSNIVNEKLGNPFTTSADFASRRMGDIGRIASVKGQEFVGIANNASREMLTPLATRLRSQITTQAGLNEFNDIINVLAGIDGYRNIDSVTGELYRLVKYEGGAEIKEPIRDAKGKVLKPSEGMKQVLLAMDQVSSEMYNFKNTINKIQGFKELNNIGLWIPSFNPLNKFIAYVIDTETAEAGRVKLLMGKSPEELATLVDNFKKAQGTSQRYKVVTKAQQEDFNFWNMRQDPMDMDRADISKFHSGASGLAQRVVDDEFASTVIENLHNRVLFYGRQMQQMYLDDIMKTLDSMSEVNRKFTANQPTSVKNIGVAQRQDAAAFIKNVLLGNPNLDQYTTWRGVNDKFASMVEWGARKAQEAYRGILSGDIEKRVLKPDEFIRFNKELESIGIRSPFKNFDAYVAGTEKRDAFQGIKLEVSTNQTSKSGNKDMVTYDIRKDGKLIGYVDAHKMGTEIYVDYIYANGANSIGTDAVRAIASEFQRIYPDAKTIAGERVTGVRGKAQGIEGANMIRVMDESLPPDIAGPDLYTSVRLPGAPKTVEAVNQLEQLRADAVARRLNIPYARAEQIIAAGNSVLATIALKVMEVGHAVTTAISWPIMMLPEFYRAFPKTYLGNALGEGVDVAFPARAIYDGIRFRHSDMAKSLIQKWITEGFGTSIVSEATELNQLLNTASSGGLKRINQILESDILKKLSHPSNFAESESRLWVLSIGYQAAKRIYPGISSADADLFAKEFLMKSIGNYYSAQRPAMFQGTFGVSIGLFQTYMLSWAQQMYRNIEERSFKAMASQMLSQAGLFGMGSTPLYDQFSKTIGEHFSDKHYDLTTGTYRALPDPLAEFLVYGLPASLGVGLYTRGDLQPRVPFVQDNPLDTFAAINATRQTIAAMGHTLSKVYEANGMSDKFRGLLEGIAMQSLSRPMARIVEAIPLPDGNGGFRAVGAISRQGNTISTSAEVWSGPGLMSRLMASRSTEEQVKREADYLNTFYGSVDHANRKRATEALKSSIRGGTLNEDTLSQVAREYLRTGTATGWKAALNEALATSEGGIDYKLGKRLRPDSPLMKMIDENY